MKKIMITILNLQKSFIVYRHPFDYLKELITFKSYHFKKMALKDVTFDIQQGKIVGVIGRNGSGKSTLLKIIAGIMDYDSGEVHVNGRVSSILELGTGFHSDYSGRENIELGGTLLGMSKKEIAAKTDSIIEFSELSNVIDQPFRTYSTGMKARLTFATAISIDPDLLIVDEALSVGDTLFQEKCFRRIRQLAEKNVTILFVTHSMGQIYELCDEAILLSEGSIIKIGSPQDVGYAYEKLLAEDRAKTFAITEPSVVFDSGNKEELDIESQGKVRIQKCLLIDDNGVIVRHLYRGRNYKIRIEIMSTVDITNSSIGFRIERNTGLVVYGISAADLDISVRLFGGERKIIDFEFNCLLQNGSYVISCGIAEMLGSLDFLILHTIQGALSFDVSGKNNFQGLCDMRFDMSINPPNK